jgi:hypothetical protein
MEKGFKPVLVLMFSAALFTQLAVSRAAAQMIFLSDNRSVNASGSIDTNAMATAHSMYAMDSIAYSGGHSLAAIPPGAFQHFDQTVEGGENASMRYRLGANEMPAENYAGSSSAMQTSFLTTSRIFFEGTVSAGGMGGRNFSQYGREHSSSLLQVSFQVADPVSYQFSWNVPGSVNTASTLLTWILQGSNDGTIFSSGYGRVPSPPTDYLGLLVPGQTYTLSLSAVANQGGFNGDGGYGTLTGVFVVPEPSAFSLIALGIGALALARRHRS